MKKLIYVLLVLVPAFAFSQQPWYKSSVAGELWQNVGNPAFSDSAYNLLLTFSPSGEPYVSFVDMPHHIESSVMKYADSSWVYVGTRGITDSYTAIADMVFDTAGVPYALCNQYYYGSYVLKYNGYSWVDADGSQSINDGNTQNGRLAISPQNHLLYIFFEDQTPSHQGDGSVMKFDGTSWVLVGPAFFIPASTYGFDKALAFNSNGDLYIAFQDYNNSNKASVMKFNGSYWVYIGTPGFSTGGAYNINLAFGPANQPYIAYSDNGNSSKASVKKFDGTNWITVGTEGFSEGPASSTSLALNPQNGQPFVAYVDVDHGSFSTVKKYDGSNWVTVGPLGFSAAEVRSTSLAFNSNGEPHVAFSFGELWQATVMKYSYPNSIDEQENNPIIFFPNPVKNILTVETPGTLKGGSLVILNLNGLEVVNCPITIPKTQIDISKLPSGVYFVRLSGDKTVQVGKFIKE